MKPNIPFRRARAGSALAAAVVLATGCATMREAFSRPPSGEPTDRAGWLRYRVGQLEVQVPQDWRPQGDDRRLTLTAPGEAGRLELARAEQAFPGEKECLAAAEEALVRGEGAFERVRRHPTRLAGRPAIVQEADQKGWHGWAYAVCDGGVQYRLFLVGRSPLTREVTELYQDLTARTRIGGAA